MTHWQLQHAKNRLSEVVERARREGPQMITRRGVETAVLVSVEEFQRLSHPKDSLTDFFRSSPLAEIELEVERDPDPGRTVEL